MLAHLRFLERARVHSASFVFDFDLCKTAIVVAPSPSLLLWLALLVSHTNTPLEIPALPLPHTGKEGRKEGGRTYKFIAFLA